MKRYIILGVLCALSLIGQAKNCLFYFRYDQPTNDTPALLRYLKARQAQTDGRFILFYKDALYENEELRNLYSSTTFLENEDVYYYSGEREVFFDEVSKKLLVEKRAKGTRHVVGENDNEWEVYFLVHENSDVKQLCWYISAAEYNKRPLQIHYLHYDTNGKIKEVDYSTFIKYVKIKANF